MAHAIAVEVANSQIRACLLAERDPRILNSYTDAEDLGERPNVNTTMGRIRSAVDRVRVDAGLEWKNVTGVGVTIPNSINKYGVIVEGTMLKGWDGLNVVRLLQRQFPEIAPRHIVVYNDQHAVALAELAYGAGEGRPAIDLVSFIITAGIGAGIVTDGKLHVGESGAAGEVGHVVIDSAELPPEICGRPCTVCGRQDGCLETVSSGTAMARRAAELIQAGRGTRIFEAVVLRTKAEEMDPQQITDDGGGSYDFHSDLIGGGRTYRIWARDVIAMAQAGDPEAQQIVADAGRGLGKAIVMVLHTLNPQMIVVGGVIGRASPIYLDAAEDWVRHHALRAARSIALILPSNLEDLGPLYGAAAGVFAAAKDTAESAAQETAAKQTPS